MSKILKWSDTSYIANFVIYPAWQGPQIIAMIEWSVAPLDFKIIRHESTFPESITDGDEIISSTSVAGEVNIMNDKSSLEAPNWYYYSVFVDDGGWTRVGYAECFTFGTEWARENLWKYHVPERPFKIRDSKTGKQILQTNYFNWDGNTLASITDDDDPQEVLYDQETLGWQYQLRRYIKFLSFEIDKHADMVKAFPKMFAIKDAPVFMLNLISELLKMEFKKDFTPRYKRQLLRFAVPRMKRKGVNQLVKWITRLLLENTSVYIEEYTDHIMYWNDVGGEDDMNGDPSPFITESKGSFWFGPNLVGNVHNCFVEGSFLADNTSDRIYSPYVYGIFAFYNVEPNISAKLAYVLSWYLKRNIVWLARWFLALVQPITSYHTDAADHKFTCDQNWQDLSYSILCWNYPDGGGGWNDPFDFLPDIS